MSVAGIYDAFTRRSMKNHHQAEDDVKATIQILRESDISKLRKQGLQNKVSILYSIPFGVKLHPGSQCVVFI